MVEMFEKILSMSLTGCYIILVVLAVRLLLRICERKYSFFLWFVVFLNLCFPISIQGPFTLVPDIATGGNEQTTFITSTEAIGTGEIIYEPTDVQQNSIPEQNMDNRALSWQSVGSTIWILVVAVIWSICIVKAIKLTRLFRKGNDGGEVLGDGIVYIKGIDTPFIWGLFNAVIYIPENLEEEERDYILAHENFHRKRRDHITKIVFFVIASIHWFNPLVWLSYVLFVHDMEISCDEAVLSRTRRDIKKQYANSKICCNSEQICAISLNLWRTLY